MAFRIAKGDILKLKYDVFVVPSQPSLKLEGPIGDSIKNACGMRLQYELKQCKEINIGQCVITNAYNLNCKKLIHVANPMWKGGDHNEEENLYDSYWNCLEYTDSFGLESVAFPLLSSGNYKFPKRRSIEIAIEAITNYLSDVNPDLDVVLVIFDEPLFKTYPDIFKNYQIVKGSFGKKTKEMIRMGKLESQRFGWYFDNSDELLENTSGKKKFIDALQAFMIKKGIDKEKCCEDVVSLTMFSKYLKGESTPKKYTAIGLCLNLKLSIEETNVVLKTIDERLDKQLERDSLAIYCLLHRKHVSDLSKAFEDAGYPPLTMQ